MSPQPIPNTPVKHLLIVGRRRPASADDKEIDPVAGSDPVAKPGDGIAKSAGSFLVRTCSSPSEIISVVRGSLNGDEKLDTLDLYDHAAPGKVKMGSDILFNYTGTGYGIAEELGEYLTQDARVRLLGCRTAMQARGQKLLLGLRDKLGEQRVVFGTINGITPTEFDEGGFRTVLEELLLFSSADAAKGLAPTASERLKALVQAQQRSSSALPPTVEALFSVLQMNDAELARRQRVGGGATQRKPTAKSTARSGRVFRHVTS